MTNQGVNILNPMEKPAHADAIEREWGALEKMWGDALTAKAQAYSYYTQDYSIWDDNRYRGEEVKWPEYHSPQDSVVIRNAVNAHLAYHPRFHYEPNGKGDDFAEAAGRVERSMGAVLVDAFDKQSGSQPGIPTKVNGTELMLTNHTSLGFGWHFDALKRPVKKTGEGAEEFERREWEWESQNQTWNPIRVFVPAPGEVLFNSTDASPTIAISKRKIKAFELSDWSMKAEGKGKGTGWDMEGKDPYDDVTILERWTSRWVSVVYDGELVYVEDNPYWLVPYVQIWGGNIVSIAGKDFNIAQWVKQAMIFPLMDTLRMINQNIAARHHLLIRTMKAAVVVDSNPREWATQAGSSVKVAERDSVWIEPLPDVTPGMFQENAELDRAVELGSYSRQASGFKETGVRTATEAASLHESFNRVFLGIVSRLESGYSILGSGILRIHNRLSKELPDEYGTIIMGAERLRVKDLGKPPQFNIRAKFEQIDIAARSAEKADALIWLKEGLIDRATAQQIGGFENGAEMDRLIDKDRVEMMPEVMAQKEITALIEMGYLEIAERKIAEARTRGAQAQAGGLVGPQGQPLGGGQGQQVAPPQQLVGPGGGVG